MMGSDISAVCSYLMRKCIRYHPFSCSLSPFFPSQEKIEKSGFFSMRGLLFGQKREHKEMRFSFRLSVCLSDRGSPPILFFPHKKSICQVGRGKLSGDCKNHDLSVCNARHRISVASSSLYVRPLHACKNEREERVFPVLASSREPARTRSEHGQLDFSLSVVVAGGERV